MRSSIVLLVVWAAACTRPSKLPDEGDRGEPSVESRRDRPAPGPPVGDVDELPRLELLSDADVLNEFGPPSTEREFTMKDCCTEFQIELQNHYPPGKGHDAVAIREWTWKYDGYALTVWLHEQKGSWVVLDTCRYSDGVKF